MHIKNFVHFQAFAKWRWANGGADGLMIAHLCWKIVSSFQDHKMVDIWSKKAKTKDLPKGIYIVNGKKVVKQCVVGDQQPLQAKKAFRLSSIACGRLNCRCTHWINKDNYVYCVDGGIYPNILGAICTFAKRKWYICNIINTYFSYYGRLPFN